MAKKHLGQAGHVYILTNAAFRARCVKIGKTTRDPETRANELSNHTGIPVAFNVAYSIETSDCHTLEKIVHAHLAKKRINQRREFFEIEVNEAIAVLEKLAKEVEKQSSGYLYPRSIKILLWVIAVLLFAFIFSALVRM